MSSTTINGFSPALRDDIPRICKLVNSLGSPIPVFSTDSPETFPSNKVPASIEDTQAKRSALTCEIADVVSFLVNEPYPIIIMSSREETFSSILSCILFVALTLRGI